MMLAVADTTVLSNFVHIGKPELLVSAFDSLVTVRAVMTEIEAGTKLGKIPGTDWTWLVVAELTQDETRRFEALNQTLGRGEAACLALAEARQALVLTDDRDARRVAASLDIRVSGTLGALVNLVQAGEVSVRQADTLLEDMAARGYRTPVRTVSELLNRGC